MDTSPASLAQQSQRDAHAAAVAAAQEAVCVQADRHAAAESAHAVAVAAHEKAQHVHSNAEEAVAAAQADVAAAGAAAEVAAAADGVAEVAWRREQAAVAEARVGLRVAEEKQREVADMRASESALDRVIADLLQLSQAGVIPTNSV